MHSPGDITSDTYQRRIVIRPDVGATATVRQVSEVRIASLLVMQPSLIVITRGLKIVSCESQEICAGTGEAVFLRGGRYDVVNRPDTSGIYEAFWLAWTPESPESDRREHSVQPSGTVSHLRHFPKAMADALLRAHQGVSDPSLPDAIARHRMKEVLSWMNHCGICTGTGAADHSLPARVSALIASDLTYPWTLKDAASRLVVSSATLRRTLSATGTGFSELLIDARMSAALSLLQSTDRPVEHIAPEVGYASPSRFSVRFRARFGFAPSAIRGHKRRVR